jgi:hypothetical protein
MSGSGDDKEVRVNISAETTSFIGGTKGAVDAARQLTSALTETGAAIRKLDYQNVTASTERARLAIATFGASLKGVNPVWLETGQGAMRLADAMNEAGGSLRKLTPEMLGLGSSTNTMYAAIAKATEAQRAKLLVTKEDTAASARMAAATATAAAAAGISVEQYTAEARAIALTRLAAEEAGAQMHALAGAFASTAGPMRDAEESAHRFVSALNPTPLSMLRTLFNGTAKEVEALRASLVRVTTASEDAAAKFAANIKAIVAQRAAAAEAGAEYNKLAQAFATSGNAAAAAQTTYADFWHELGRTTSTQAQLIAKLSEGAAATHLFGVELKNSEVGSLQFNIGVKNAADSAQFFKEQIDGVQTPLEKLRTLMASSADATHLFGLEIATTSKGSLQFNIGVKSAADSAQFFTEQLDGVQSPLEKLRTLMAATTEATHLFGLELATTAKGSLQFNIAIKSAADSAAFFLEQLDGVLTPLQKLKTLMEEASVSTRRFGLDLETTARGSLQFNQGVKSAADSARFFKEQMDGVQSPLEKLRTLMTDAALETHRFGLELATTARGSLQFNQGVKSAAESTAFFEQQLNGVQTPLQKMKTLLGEDIPEGAHKSASGFSNITREIIVMGHEALTGRFSRIPASLLVLMEYSGGVQTKLVELGTAFIAMSGIALTAVGVVAAAVVALGATIARTIEAVNALRRVGNEAVLLGQNVASARSEAAALNTQLQGIGVGQTEALKVAAGLQTLTGATAEQKSQLADLATGMALALGITPEQATEKLVAALDKGGAGVKSLMDEYHLWDVQNGLVQRSQVKLATDTHDSAALMSTTIAALNARFPEYLANLKKVRETKAPDFQFESGPAQAMALPDAPQRAEDPKTEQQRNETIAHTGEKNRQLVLTKDLEAAQAQLASASTAAQRDLANESIRATTVLIEEEKRRGDDTLAQKQEAQLAALIEKRAQAGGEARKLAEDEKTIRVQFWEQEAAKADQTEAAITREKTNASHARTGLLQSEARDAGTYSQQIARNATAAGEAALVAADHQHKSTQAMQEAATSAEYQVYLKASQDMTRVGVAADTERADFAARASRLHMSLLKEDATASAQAAKQELDTWLAMMHEKENAAHDDFTKVSAIQQQIVDRLRSMGAAQEAELSRQDTIRRAHATQQAEIANASLAKERAADTAELGQVKANLDEQVTQNAISKGQELAALRAYAQMQYTTELQAQQAYIDTLSNQPKALQSALDTMTEMKARFAEKDAQYNAQIAANQKASWDKATGPVESAITGQIGALLRGTETAGMAVRKMAGDIVSSYATMAAKAALSWAGSQAMQILWTGTAETAKTGAVMAGTATRTALAAGANATENTGLLVKLGHWIAAELGMTSATTANTAVRTAAQTTSDATANAGLLVRLGRWIATELGLTSATEAQSVVRTATQEAADATTLATALAANVGQAESYAAVGATAAGASVAAIPYVGWAMAPGVAAETYASLSGFAALASLATGSYNVPQNMLANLHAGEMVVPETFASGIRGAMGSGGAGGGGGDNNLTYAPHINSGSADMSQTMRQQAAQMKSFMWHATRNGALTLPGR